jgi:putative ribosome biogenesis GTPase RsgA
MRAEILASHGRQYWVRELSSAVDSAPLDDMPAVQPGKQRLAVTRGRRQDYCVGDQVEIETIGSDQAVINGLESRRNLLKRSDAFRQKLIAANIDQIGYVLAGEPPFSEPLAARVLVAASIASIPITWLVNKSDRVAALACIEPRLKLYRSLGVHTIYLSARDDEPETWLEGTLGSWLNEKTTLLMGQSGMGKSTLMQTLRPNNGLKRSTRVNTRPASLNALIFPNLIFRPAAELSILLGFSNSGLRTVLVLKLRIVCLNGLIGQASVAIIIASIYKNLAA